MQNGSLTVRYMGVVGHAMAKELAAYEEGGFDALYLGFPSRGVKVRRPAANVEEAGIRGDVAAYARAGIDVLYLGRP